MFLWANLTIEKEGYDLLSARCHRGKMRFNWIVIPCVWLHVFRRWGARTVPQFAFTVDRWSQETAAGGRVSAMFEEAIEQLVSNGTGSPVLITDEQQRVVALNKPAERMFGCRSSDVVGKRCFNLLCGQDPFGNRFCHERCVVSTMAGAGESIRYFEIGLETEDGERIGAGVNILVLRSPTTSEMRIVHFLQPLPPGQAAGAAALQRKAGSDGAEEAHPGRGANGNGRGNGHRPALSPRESEVLRYLASGKSCQEIATCLFISLLTARNHIRNILRKLDVHSQLEAVAFAHRQGLV